MVSVGVSSQYLPDVAEMLGQNLYETQIVGSFNIWLDSESGSVISRFKLCLNESLRFTTVVEKLRSAPREVLESEFDCKVGSGSLRDELS